MRDVTADSHGAGVDVLPLEVDWFRDTITVIQLMRLETSTRADIDARTRELLDHLRELVSEDLGADQNDDVMSLIRQAYKYLDLCARPTSVTPAFHAFTYLRELATISFSLLKVYVAKNQAQPSDYQSLPLR